MKTNKVREKQMIVVLASVALVAGGRAAVAEPLGSSFTYQGQLKREEVPVDDETCSLRFSLWDGLTVGAPVGDPQMISPVAVKNGLFTVDLDFGAGAFNGDSRWLEVEVCCADVCAPEDFTTLAPRQKLAAVPHALQTRGIFVDANGNASVDGNISATGKLHASAYASTSPLIFEAPAGIERARIDDVTGNVGIGTPSPVDSLHVAGSAVFQGPGPWVDVRAFGATGDDDLDDTIAIQAAIDSLQGKCDGICVGGSNDGRACVDNTMCPGGVCGGVCIGGDQNGNACTGDKMCPNGICGGVCVGGGRDGTTCNVDMMCPDGTCDPITYTCMGGDADGWGCSPHRACPASGTVFFPPGKYRITSVDDKPALIVTSNNIVLRGAGSSSQLHTSGGGDLLQINGASSVFVDSLDFQGGDNTGWSIHARQSPDTRIMRCSFSNTSTSAGAISLENSWSSTVNNCHIGSIQGTAIYLGASHATWIAGNRIDGNASRLSTGVSIQGTQDVRLSGNTIESHAVAIDFNGATGISIDGCYFEMAGTDVAIRNVSGKVAGLHVSGCFFGGGPVGSQSVIDLAHMVGAVIQGNAFTGPSSGSGAPPIRITNGPGGRVDDSIFGPNYYAIGGMEVTDPQVIVCSTTGEAPWEDFNCSSPGLPSASVLVHARDGTGIGTNEPSERLHVDGNIRANGTIQSGNSITINGTTDTITASGGTIRLDDDHLQTSGLIESTGGGFKLPDGTILDEASDLGGGFALPFSSSVGTPGNAFSVTNTYNGPILYTALRGEVSGGNGVAVDGVSSGGTAIRGTASAQDGIAASFKNSAGGTALEVTGPSEFGGGQAGGLLRVLDSSLNESISLQGATGIITASGRIQTAILEITGGSDLSEGFNIANTEITAGPGTVVCIDPANPGQLVVCSRGYDSTVAGVISGAGGVETGLLMGQADSLASGRQPVALTGRVYVKADATTAPIRPGQLLTTSDVPGYAMRALDHRRAQGAILGKAMTELERGKSLVLVLVTLQ